MKRIITIAAALCLVFGLLTAEAGQRDKPTRDAPPKGKRTEMPEGSMDRRDFDEFPTMTYVTGTLNQSGMGTWRVGEMDLVLRDGCTISAENEDVGFLRDGSKALVMGPKAGNTIVAWSVRVMGPDYSDPTPSFHFTREPGSNPNVGVIRGRPE
jgi:hypothetical protein